MVKLVVSSRQLLHPSVLGVGGTFQRKQEKVEKTEKSVGLGDTEPGV